MPKNPISSEAFLHFIWQTLRFETSGIQTLLGEKVQIIHPGTLNPNQGPDFLHAKIRMGDTFWSGHVELHVNPAEWYHHNHDKDPLYNNTILHVTWRKGIQAVRRQDGTKIPEIWLSDRVAPQLIQTYEQLFVSQASIPCATQVGKVHPYHVNAWLARLAIERVEQKAMQIQVRLSENIQDWDQVVFEELASMMGGPVNRDAFRELGSRVPIRILAQYREQLPNMEALLLGMAGFLEKPFQDDPYAKSLRQNWNLLKDKHRLEGPISIPVKFLRMRPAAFPTLRLAQLAQLIATYPVLTQCLQAAGFPSFISRPIAPSPYWNTHYRLGQLSSHRAKFLGRNQKEILVINTLLPLSYLYARAHGREDHDVLIENVLSTIKAEKNQYTRLFASLGFPPQNAFQSQGMAQLKKRYCNEKRCLECRIGYQILKGKGEDSVSESGINPTVSTPLLPV